MECYQAGCAERPTWQLRVIYRPSEPGAQPIALESAKCACWNHRAQLVRSYGGARGALKIQASLRERGVDPMIAAHAVASVTPIFR